MGSILFLLIIEAEDKNWTTRQKLRKSSNFHILLLSKLSTRGWLAILKKSRIQSRKTWRIQTRDAIADETHLWLLSDLVTISETTSHCTFPQDRLDREGEVPCRILPGSCTFPFCFSSNCMFSRRDLLAGSGTKVGPQSLLTLVWDVVFPSKQQKRQMLIRHLFLLLRFLKHWYSSSPAHDQPQVQE